jgi:hypothetical protein
MPPSATHAQVAAITRGRALESAVVEPVRVVLALRWSLSREAAVAAGLVEAAASEPAPPAPVLEILVPWDGPTVERVAAAVLDGDRRDEVALEGVSAGVWVSAEDGLRHLDLPGLVRVTARRDGAGATVLFARTELLGRLGLGGGRYDFQGATLGTLE